MGGDAEGDQAFTSGRRPVRFILDANIVTGIIKDDARIIARLNAHTGDHIYLCQPVYYELVRGLLWKKASAKMRTLQKWRARLSWYQLVDEDWGESERIMGVCCRQRQTTCRCRFARCGVGNPP